MAIEYLFALILDGSPKALAVLHKIFERLRKHWHDYLASRYEEMLAANKSLVTEGDLGNMVLKNAFFLSQRELRRTTAKLMSFNLTKDKALIWVNVDYAAQYHVVVSKCGQEWKYYSIRLAVIS